jgi:hypothetical protein
MKSKLLQFVILFAVIYSIFIYWGSSNKWINKKVIDTYAQIGEKKYSTFKTTGIAKFEAEHPEKLEKYEIIISMTNDNLIQKAKDEYKRTGVNLGAEGLTTELNTWNFVYLPMMFMVALILAAPVVWKRKVIALPVGILLMHWFIVFKIYVFVYDKFQDYEWLALSELSPFKAKMLDKSAELFVHLGTSMFIAVLIWFVTCFSKEDWKKWSNID